MVTETQSFDIHLAFLSTAVSLQAPGTTLLFAPSAHDTEFAAESLIAAPRAPRLDEDADDDLEEDDVDPVDDEDDDEFEDDEEVDDTEVDDEDDEYEDDDEEEDDDDDEDEDDSDDDPDELKVM